MDASPQSVVTVVGEKSAPRYVFVVDRVAGVLEEGKDVGLDAKDQVLKFQLARLEDVGAFFRVERPSYENVVAFIFMQIGQDDLSVDAGTGPVEAKTAEVT